MASAKVVGIHGVKAPQGAAGVPLPKELVKIRDIGKEQIRAALIELFNNADDALFAMADKAESNNDQSLYFEAMRELRLQKKQIVLSTLSAAVKSFQHPSKKEADPKVSEDAPSIDSLSLVDDESLEFDVAIEGMVQRVRSGSSEDLSALKARMKVLWNTSECEDRNIPLAPEALCEGFVDACKSLEANIRVKLTLFKLFERYVLVALPKLYVDVNQSLINDGVLPEFKVRQTNRSVQQSSVPSSNGTAFSANSSIGSGVEAPEYADAGNSGVNLDALRQLLHPQGQPIQGNTPVSGLHASSSSASAAPVISQNELVAILSRAQSLSLEQAGSFVGENQAIDFAALLRDQSAGAVGKAYESLDADMINLVSMLFEFILEDRQLQPEMKAIISRLQIPILKVALIDDSFFNKGGHPARKLLNEIASSAIGWNAPREGRRDRFKEKLEGIVEQIINGFEQDVSMFDGLLSDFESFVDSERKRGLLVEQRTRDSERGKAAANDARQAAQDVINEAIEGKSVPDLGVELLRDAWSKVLVFKLLREGEQSEAWNGAKAIVNELVWSLCPDPSEQDARAKLLKMIPSLVKRVRLGFDEVALDDTLAKRLLSGLEDQHVLSLQALQQQIDLSEIAPVGEVDQQEASELLQDDFSEQSDEVSDLVRSTLELEDDFKQLQEACEQANEKRAAIEAENEKLPKKQESIVLVDQQAETRAPELAPDNPFVQQVERFVVGCWFEFGGGDNKERCKLAAIIKSTGKHIFVNRAGVKVHEKYKDELAKDLCEGQLVALNDGLLFDRALESIITNLRS
ncbi:MAG: DUF1631 domain-containing protein [Oleiphilaceae bacterium]|nr:DUF1631 domain-containing protein [Oleiphilaceae bacterium]